MITPLVNVTIQGSNQIFGGYIYGVSYRIGFGPNPSSMTFRIANNSGVYNISNSNIGYSTIYKIQINQNVYSMYLVSYNQEQDAQGSRLEVEFNDTSIPYLDRLNVLANGKYYNSAIYNSPYVIPLGTAYNKYSYYDSKDALQFVYEPERNNYFYLDVPQVYYTATQFALALTSYVPCDASVSNILTNPNFQYYKMNYWGLLRTVLQQIGQDLAFNFFWNENEQLQLIDLSKPIPLNFQPYQNATRNSQSATVKGTFAFGVSSFYGRDGYLPQLTDQQNLSLVKWNFTPDNFGLPVDPNSGSLTSNNFNVGTQVSIGEQPYWNNLTAWAQCSKSNFNTAFIYQLMASLNNGQTQYQVPLQNGWLVSFLNASVDYSTSIDSYQIANIFNNVAQQMNAGGNSQYIQIMFITAPNPDITIDTYYEAYQQWGLSNGAVYYCPLNQSLAKTYASSRDFKWYNQNELVKNITELKKWFSKYLLSNPDATVQQLFQSNQNNNLPAYMTNGQNPIHNTLSQNAGYGVVEIDQKWDTSAAVSSNLWSFIPTPISFNSNDKNLDVNLQFVINQLISQASVEGQPTPYVSMYAVLNLPGTAQNLLSIQNQIVAPKNIQNSITVTANSLTPSFVVVGRQMDTLFTDATAANSSTSKVIIDMQAVDDILLGSVGAGTNASNIALAQTAHQLYTQNLMASQQIAPIQEQSFTIPGINIPPVTIAQGLQGIDITYSPEGVLTTVSMGNRIAQPLNFSITREKLVNDILVKQTQLNTAIKIGPIVNDY